MPAGRIVNLTRTACWAAGHFLRSARDHIQPPLHPFLRRVLGVQQMVRTIAERLAGEFGVETDIIRDLPTVRPVEKI